MKKTFLKATLFSLMVSMVPAVITSCKDYDDDIKSLTTKDDQLQSEISDKLAQQEQALTNQIKALETALAEQKEAAATATEAAKAAADAAQAAADKAQQTADAAKKAAAEADAKAQAANAEAEAAKAAAAQAKADAIEEAKTMVEALRADITKQMADLDAKYGQKYEELAEAVGKAATKESLDAAVKSLTADIDALEKKFNASEAEIKEILEDYLALINKNTSDITAINGKITGISSDINTLKTDLGKLEGRVAANEAEIAEHATKIENNATAIAANASAITKITSETIPALKAELENKIDAVNTALETHVSEFNAYQQQVDMQLAALNLFMNTYSELLAGLQDKLDGIDTQIAELYVKYGEVAAELAQAKLDILENASKIEDLEGVVAANKAELESKIGQLSSQLTSAVETLNQKIDTVKEQLQQSIDGVQTNLDNAVADLQGKIDTINETLATINETLGDHGSRITALEGTVEQQGQAIAALQADLQQAQRDIVKINGALSTLNAINAKRLTSVTLIPSSYVGGIPTIDFFSARFVPMVAGANGEYTPAAPGTEPMIITNQDTQALYRLNPSGVMLEDIVADGVTFVQQVATSRAAATEPVVKVANVEKGDNGMLIVNATKSESFTSDLNSAGNGKIYTVSLRVPIAEKNYYTWTDSEGNTVTEAAEDAVVYSEYARVSETTFTPGIAAVYGGADVNSNLPLLYNELGNPWNHGDNDPDFFFYTKAEAMPEASLDGVTVAPVYVTVPYNVENFDLTQFVTAYKSMQEGSSTVTKYLDNYDSYPFTFSYEFVPTDYTKGYAIVEDGKLTPASPAGATTASRIGKVVTVRVTMKYQDKVVDQKYFNVQYVLSAEPVMVYFNKDQFTHFTWDLYTPLASATDVCLWEDTKSGENVVEEGFLTQFCNAINAQSGNEGFTITRAEFNDIYSTATITKSYVENGTETVATEKSVETNLTSDNDWIVKNNGVAQDFYEVDDINGKGVKVLVTFKPNSICYPDVTLELTGKVVWPKVPVFGVVDSPRTWTVKGAHNQLNLPIDNFEQTQKLAPMSYETAKKNDVTKVAYKGNVLTGRTMPYLINQDEKDPIEWAWDIVVNQDKGYLYDWYVEGVDTESAATVWENKDAALSYDLTYDDSKDLASYKNVVSFTVNDNEGGRALVNQEKPLVDLIWNVYLNGKEANNLYTVGHTFMHILKPITKVYFTEIPAIEQNFAEQSVNVSEYLWAEDQYTTDNSASALNYEGGAFDMSYTGKWKYYGFKNITYSIDMEKVPATEVPYYTQLDIEVDPETGVLTFTTENTSLQAPLDVIIDVTGDYAFGSFKTTAKVTITNNPVSSHARKR